MFELGALSPLNIQIQVEASGDEEKDDRIAALEMALAAATEKRGPGRPRKESEAA